MKIQKLLLSIVILMCCQMGFAQQGINYKTFPETPLSGSR
jgi:hypothetical protein